MSKHRSFISTFNGLITITVLLVSLTLVLMLIALTRLYWEHISWETGRVNEGTITNFDVSAGGLMNPTLCKVELDQLGQSRIIAFKCGLIVSELETGKSLYTITDCISLLCMDRYDIVGVD